MSREELKIWAKNKIKENFGKVLGVIVLYLIISNFTISRGWTTDYSDGFSYTSNVGISIGWLLYFVTVGFYYCMVNYINNVDFSIKDLFKYSEDFGRCLVTNLLQMLYIFLWGLLFIIPGVIKLYAYAMVPFLLGDEKYKDLGYKDLLKKSEEMMDGHKMDYFVLGLSFIGWHFLAIFTLGLLEIWILPYEFTACIKFLYDIKTDYETKNGMITENNDNKDVVNEKENKSEFCPNCGSKVTEDSEFCSSCGTKLK